MKKIFISILATLFIMGCSSSDSTAPTSTTPLPQPTVVVPPEEVSEEPILTDNSVHVIYDNDHFDPDWVIGLDTIIELHRNGRVTLEAVVLSGTDIYGKGGLKYNTILTHHGLGHIPIGINHRTHMRTTPDDASATYPKTDPRYVGPIKDITHFPSDQLGDAQRVESVKLLCEVLGKAKEKSITYIVGGHLQNFSDLLKETEMCHGWGEVHSKIKQLVINTGNIDSGKPCMNLSEGRYDVTEASKATNTVFDSTFIPILVTEEFKDTLVRPGDVYLTHKRNSPMDFILSVDRYGVYGDHGVSDNAAIMVGVHGTNFFGHEFVNKKRVCFDPNNYGALMIVPSCGEKEHYHMNNMNLDIVAYYTIDLLKQP